jgi:hypothetical protein
LYKVNKNKVECEEAIDVNNLVEVLTKVAKKEEMAKNVLTGDILSKFKQLKENLLKTVILAYNLS